MNEQKDLSGGEPSIPAGGWGSLKEVSTILFQEHIPVEGAALLRKQNKPDGYACVSCAWAKPAHPHPAEFCESGAKATAWEVTSKRVDPDFFARHTVRELESWHDHDLEELGRLTVPLRWDAASDRYVQVAWDDAFADIGARLRALDPNSVVFYSSGRRRWKLRTCGSCWRACMGTTTCRTPPTCVTKARPWR